MRYTFVGTIRKVRPGDPHVVGEIPGKIALVIDGEVDGELLGYFPSERRPRVGTRVGVHGQYVVMDVPLERIPLDERGPLFPGCKPVQHQLDVTDWNVVSDDYDFLFDSLLQPGPGS